MKKKEFISLLDKQIKGLTTEREDELISDIYDQIQERNLDWETWEEQQIKTKIKEQIDLRISERAGQGFIFPIYLKWAASIALIVVLGLMFFLSETREQKIVWIEKSTNDQQKATITLSDGSSILLNTNSRLRYPAQFLKEKRNIILDGEAFFEVTPNESQPFIVISRGVITEVLGTSFNINAQKGKDVEVAVQSGLVGVSRENEGREKPYLVNPNQKATIQAKGKGISIEPVDINYQLAWRAESISFDLVPFEEVVDRLASLYNLTIDLEGIEGGTCLIKATYSNKSLYTVLYGLKNLVDFKAEKINDRHLVIKYNGCK